MTATTTRRHSIAALALGLLLAGGAPLAAQGFHGGRADVPGRGIRAALEALDLTADQKVKVQQLFDDEKPKLEALRQEGRTARQALRSSSEAAPPDPATVGTAFLRLQAHRKAVRAEREATREKLEAILTPEQRAMLDGWREAHRQAGRAFARPRHGAPER